MKPAVYSQELHAADDAWHALEAHDRAHPADLEGRWELVRAVLDATDRLIVAVRGDEELRAVLGPELDEYPTATTAEAEAAGSLIPRDLPSLLDAVRQALVADEADTYMRRPHDVLCEHVYWMAVTCPDPVGAAALAELLCKPHDSRLPLAPSTLAYMVARIDPSPDYDVCVQAGGALETVLIAEGPELWKWVSAGWPGRPSSPGLYIWEGFLRVVIASTVTEPATVHDIRGTWRRLTLPELYDLDRGGLWPVVDDA